MFEMQSFDEPAQILRFGQNPEVYEILKAFEQQTARDIIFNTSYNLMILPSTTPIS